MLLITTRPTEPLRAEAPTTATDLRMEGMLEVSNSHRRVSFDKLSGGYRSHADVSLTTVKRWADRIPLSRINTSGVILIFNTEEQTGEIFMPRHILIIVGHPDPNPKRLCRALAEAYAEGAEAAGHRVSRVDLATISIFRCCGRWTSSSTRQFLQISRVWLRRSATPSILSSSFRCGSARCRRC